MSFNLTNTLVVGISATALFDLREADAIFKDNFAKDRDSAVRLYREYMLERENDDLDDGTGMALVQALLNLNTFGLKSEPPLIEVVVMSRNSPETGLRVLNNIRRRELKISRYAFTGGESVADYMEAFHVDLFLTTNVGDAQKVIDAKACAAAILKERPAKMLIIPEGQVRIAFDGDAVLFDDSSELIYKDEGLVKFHEHEDTKSDIPLPEGPHAAFLKKLSKLQARLPSSTKSFPVRIAVVTARNAPAELRVVKTLREWGVYVDEMFFLGGLDKSKVLQAFRPHIFFDDQDLHLATASKIVNSGKVPYHSSSRLHILNKQVELIQLEEPAISETTSPEEKSITTRPVIAPHDY